MLLLSERLHARASSRRRYLSVGYRSFIITLDYAGTSSANVVGQQATFFPHRMVGRGGEASTLSRERFARSSQININVSNRPVRRFVLPLSILAFVALFIFSLTRRPLPPSRSSSPGKSWRLPRRECEGPGPFGSTHRACFRSRLRHCRSERA